MNYLTIISRPKLNGFGWHYGVLLSNGICFDFQPTGIRKISEHIFACGHEIRREKQVLETTDTLKRFMEVVDKKVKYDFLNFNCENFARFLVEGKSESKQISFALFLAVVFGGIYLSNKAQ